MPSISNNRLVKFHRFFKPLAILYALIMACATFFRFWKIGNIPGVNGDEAYLAFRALRLMHGEYYHYPGVDQSTYGDAIQNIFYTLPLAALHLIFEPSIPLLRIVAVLSGVLALPLNYYLCRRAYDSRTAFFSTLLLAVLPVNIAYSRFGWEPSQSLAATLIVLYLALIVAKNEGHSLRWGVLCLLALLAAFIIHPTNIFMFPFIAVAALWRWKTHCNALTVRYLPLRQKIIAGAGILLLCTFALAILQSPPVRSRLSLHSPLEIPMFLLNYERLFSGVISYRYIAGSCFWPVQNWSGWSNDLHWSDGLTLILIVIVISAFWKNIRNGDESQRDAVLGVGWILSLLIFFVIAGPNAISPSHERYGLWFLAPGALVFTRGVVALLDQKPRWNLAVYGGSLSIACVLLAGFYVNYFQFFQTTGGLSALTFRTGSIEPKKAALTYIQNHRNIGRNYLVAEDWWNYWPIRYLSASDKRVLVLFAPDIGNSDMEAKADHAFQEGRLTFIQFADDPGVSDLKQGLQSAKIPFREQAILGYSQKPVILLIQPIARKKSK